MAVLTTCAIGAVAALPLLAVGGGLDSPDDLCTAGQLGGLATSSPTITGPSTLTAAELITWWDATGRGQPPRLAVPVEDVLRMYVAEGDVEGVRGDLALAQAIHESGWFTNSDTSRNNFAGIAHPDGAGSGQAFPDALAGVRAHIQLLKKYAEGNDVRLVRPDIAPDAGGQATTWDDLAGTWAADPDYWTALSDIYNEMLDRVGTELHDASPSEPHECTTPQPVDAATPAGSLVNVRGITVDASIAGQLDAMLAVAEADGLTLTGSGYRSHARQIELRRAHCGPSHYAIYDMPSSQCSPPTARPGASMHERGLAIDFSCNGTLIATHDDPCFDWLEEHAASYGFFNLPSESWHWSTSGA